MKPDENEVQVKNAQLTLASIKSDIDSEAALLTSLLEGKLQVEKDVAEAKAEMALERVAIAAERAVLSDQRTDLLRIKHDSDGCVLRAKEELKVVVSQKNEAMKELSNLNDWNMKAEEEKKGLEASIESLKTQERERGELISDTEALKTEKKEAENALNQVRLETALLIDETTAQVKSLKDEADLAVERRIEAQEACTKAEMALYDTHNEKAQLRKDLDVVVNRIEKKYGEAFPDLRMKI